MLRKCLPLLLGALMVLTGSSCFNILETIRLNKDGSGTYTVDMDLSEAMEMVVQFAGAFEDQEESEDFMNEVMDTVISFAQAPDSAKTGWEYPEVTSRASMQVTMDAPAESMRMQIMLPFNTVEEIDQFGADLARTEDLGMAGALGENAGSAGKPVLLSAPDQFGFSKGTLSRKRVDGAALFGGEEGDEDIEMMKLFLGGATYTVRYELPGKVKKVTGEAFEQPDKHTVVMERDITDLLDNKTDLAVEIRFK